MACDIWVIFGELFDKSTWSCDPTLMQRLLFFTLILAFGVSCASFAPKISAKGKRVKITTSGPPSGCSSVGEVYGQGDAYSQLEAMESARIDLRNATADLGGNYVVIQTNNSTAQGMYNETLLVGQAYNCRESK